MEKFFSAIGRIFERLINWLLWSSVNQEKISLTLKAGVPFLVLLHIGTVSQLNDLIDGLVNLLILIATWITGSIAIYAAIRKLFVSTFGLLNSTRI